jgi:LmbE family N-acetylglucosaminyl deacetylase
LKRVINLAFDKRKDEPLHVLCLGAHSDDIEIGCGGTILRLASEHPNLSVTWVVFSARGERAAEAQQSANEFLKPVRDKNIVLKEFKDGYFPAEVSSIKDVFEELKGTSAPDVIFTHFRKDLHQDHRQICELTWNTWRNHLILEYEIPKYDGDLGSPNFFVSLESNLRARKIESLMRFFRTQTNKDWFSPETFNALMRLRGVECKSPGGYAEAFYCRKALL